MKVVYDTCLYIDWLRNSENPELFTDQSHIRFLSPIVVLELRAGAQKPKQIEVVDRLLTPYFKVNRVIDVTSKHYYRAGELLAKWSRKHGAVSKSISNDILIAISASSIGATLLTANKKDFLEISKWLPLKIKYV